MRIRIFLFSVIALVVTFATGCDDEVDNSVLQDRENRYFDLYIAANYSDVEPIEDGLYYIEQKEGTGASPDSGDYLLINYVAYTVPDENVVDTYTEEWAKDHNLYNTSVMYGPYKFMHGNEIIGLRKGLSYMKEGGISRLLFKSDLGYGVDGMGTRVSGFESMMFDVQLVEVIEDVYANELAMIADYLDTIENAVEIYDEDTDATMYYIPDVLGTGDKIETDDVLEIFYSGTLLDGREFDSNIEELSGLDVTIGAESVIAGWELGLLEFNYGGSGKLLIPHQLAYGEEGNYLSGSLQYSIPPFEALLFDISVEPELIEEDEVE